MSDNFQQTVDLREKMERQKPEKKNLNRLEKIYGEEDSLETEFDLKTISRPGVFAPNQGKIKTAVLLLAVIVVAAASYALFFRGGGEKTGNENWYAVKLVNGEIYYGQITDIKAEPVAINKVYYNYDQANNDKKEAAETGKIVLVKRGQETHGPDGSMLVYHAQVLLMEPLKNDSKVLEAILNYEK